MFRVAVVSLMPQMFDALAGHGVAGRALAAGGWELHRVNPRDYATDRHRTVDDRPYGGGPGMVMLVEPLQRALAAAKRALGTDPRVIYVSPQGRRMRQDDVKRLAGVGASTGIVLLCGRYEGVDERLLESAVDEELSIGDYVLSGGELPAMVLLDAVVRLLDGTLGGAESAAQDSFSDGLLDCPHYSRPETLRTGDGMERTVPPVLLSGHHGNVQRWREKHSLGRTWLRRPDLLADKRLTEEQRALLGEFISEWREIRETRESSGEGSPK